MSPAAALVVLLVGVSLSGVRGEPEPMVLRLAAGQVPAGMPSGAISPDGRYLAFSSRARLLAADTNGVEDVYVLDRETRRLTLETVQPDGRAADGTAQRPQVSIGGRYVAFDSLASAQTAVPDRNGCTDVVTEGANASSGAPRLSGDGRVLVFESLASNLLCGRRCATEKLDENVLPDVYLYDRAALTFRRASGARGTWWAPSVGADIDGRGDVVIFSSREAFGPEDDTADFDLFVCAPVCP